MGLTNNDVLKKLRVALKLQDTDILRILKHVEFEITKTELSALFRKDDHPNYKECGDQILRNFLNGLVIEKRGKMPPKGAAKNAAPTKPRAKSFKPRAKEDRPKFEKPVSKKPFVKPKRSQDYSGLNKFM